MDYLTVFVCLVFYLKTEPHTVGGMLGQWFMFVIGGW